MNFFNELRNWAEGVMTSAEADETPQTASPFGLNSAFFSVGQGKAVLGKREGFTTVNRTPVSGSPAIIGQHEYKKRSGNGFTYEHLLVSNTGRLDKVAFSGTVTEIAATAFTTGDRFPAFATAKDLEFIVNGTDRKKYDGTTVTNFGIVRPSAPAVAPGSAGDPDGTYNVSISYYNSATGHESSRSLPTQVVVSSEQIEVTLPTPSDPQVTHIRVHIQKEGLQSNFFHVTSGSGTGWSATHLGWASGTATATLNLSDADLNLLITISPGVVGNDPPPAGVNKIAWHGQRLFVADAVNVYWSQLDEPESFNALVNFQAISSDEGTRITALHAHQHGLLIFCNNSTHILRGTDPASWVFEPLFPDKGATGQQSIQTANGLTFWWDERNGPVMWNGGDYPLDIGKSLIARTIADTRLNRGNLFSSVTGLDTVRDRVIFAVPETGQSRNTLLLPFNYRIQRWESHGWDPFDTASFGIITDVTTSKEHLLLGGYAGQVFLCWGGGADGIAEGTYSGTFVADALAMDEFEDSTATFDTTGGKLVERKVTILDSEGYQVGRTRIVDNTSDTFEIISPISGLVAGATYTYHIGGPNFRLNTIWVDGEEPFKKKRYDYFFLHAKTPGGAEVGIDCSISLDHTEAPVVWVAIAGGEASAWDSISWDEDIWDSAEALLMRRLRVGHVGRFWRLSVSNPRPFEPIHILKVRMEGRLLTTRWG